MRKFSETTARNLLRKPLVLGVPLPGLIVLSFVVLTVFLVAGNSTLGDIITLGLSALGYGVLRVIAKLAKNGWEEELLFRLETLSRVKAQDGNIDLSPSDIEMVCPDTLEDLELISSKESLKERIAGLAPGERITLLAGVNAEGATLSEVRVSGQFKIQKGSRGEAVSRRILPERYLYSLYQLPTSTDPLWLFATLSRLKSPYRIIVGILGVDPLAIKRRIEGSRRSNAQGVVHLSDIDSEITFEESTLVLQGISRGEESVVEVSLVIASDEPLSLDPQLFCLEPNPLLTVVSVLGIRKRFHRSHTVRVVTATDLIPNVGDAKDPGSAILTTPRGAPLYFSPQDSRLEALHWLVVGATGSGKSFFTGLVLKRMMEQGLPMSVLFVDHNRSFRRIVRSQRGYYAEPRTLKETEQSCVDLFDVLNQSGVMAGIELSDLDLGCKKLAIHTLLSRIELLLRHRDTTHPIYLVLDECWNFLRDNPVLVQRAFREFRKLNGAVIAITQSLFDFLTDESGQSICQNAPIRILLRQGEDLSRYQGILALNSVELIRARLLRQKKGHYSECLIKTPFLSRIGRLYPTEAEHELLRTDNLREEIITEAKRVGKREVSSCVV